MPYAEAIMYINNLDYNVWYRLDQIPLRLYQEAWDIIETRQDVIIDTVNNVECFKKLTTK